MGNDLDHAAARLACFHKVGLIVVNKGNHKIDPAQGQPAAQTVGEP